MRNRIVLDQNKIHNENLKVQLINNILQRKLRKTENNF